MIIVVVFYISLLSLVLLLSVLLGAFARFEFAVYCMQYTKLEDWVSIFTYMCVISSISLLCEKDKFTTKL